MPRTHEITPRWRFCFCWSPLFLIRMSCPGEIRPPRVSPFKVLLNALRILAARSVCSLCEALAGIRELFPALRHLPWGFFGGFLAACRGKLGACRSLVSGDTSKSNGGSNARTLGRVVLHGLGVSKNALHHIQSMVIAHTRSWKEGKFPRNGEQLEIQEKRATWVATEHKRV